MIRLSTHDEKPVYFPKKPKCTYRRSQLNNATFKQFCTLVVCNVTRANGGNPI